MRDINQGAKPRVLHGSQVWVMAGWLMALALGNGCATSGTQVVTPAPKEAAPSLSTASQVYGLFYTLKTNAMAAAALNRYPPARVSDSGQAFLDSLNQVSPDLEFRLEFEPFVADLFLVDAGRAGGCYGCRTNATIQRQEGGRPAPEAFARGVAWVLPAGPDARKAIFILSSAGPQRTTIIMFDDPLHGRLIYDSFGNAAPDGIDYLCGVEVLDKNHFLLREGWPARVSQLTRASRSFLLDVNDQLEVRISLRD